MVWLIDVEFCCWIDCWFCVVWCFALGCLRLVVCCITGVDLAACCVDFDVLVLVGLRELVGFGVLSFDFGCFLWLIVLVMCDLA